MGLSISEEEVFDISSGSFLERFIAWLVDQAILFVPLTIFLLLSYEPIEPTTEVIRSFSQEALQIYVLINIVYFTFCEGSFGQTPGKKLMNLRVYKETGNRVGYTFALLRRVGPVIPLFLIADAVAILFSTRKQRIFDIIAGTLVVKEDRESLALGFLRDEDVSEFFEGRT